jgi:biotin-(acetyl-CoA carboxylase) ligase
VTNQPLDHEALVAGIVQSLTLRYEMLYSDEGREQTVRDWCANSSYANNRHVRVALHDHSFEGVTRGLEPDGALRVETSGGLMKIVRAGDVTALRAANVDSDQ